MKKEKKQEIEEKTLQLYCSKCGTRMLIFERYLVFYDQFSGKPIYSEQYRCPRYKIWSFSKHDVFPTVI